MHDMKPGARATGPRWLLLCLLLLGVVSMHHFVPAEPDGHLTGMAASAMSEVSQPDPMHQPHEPVPSPAHDLLHLCMAVLCVIIGLILVGLLLAMTRPTRAPSLRPQWRVSRVDRPPGLSGRALLNSVCVLRV